MEDLRMYYVILFSQKCVDEVGKTGISARFCQGGSWETLSKRWKVDNSELTQVSWTWGSDTLSCE